MIRIFYRKYPHTTEYEWSEYFADISTINLNVESKDETRHGIIALDSVNIVLKNIPGNPVYSLFQNFEPNYLHLIRIEISDSNGHYHRRAEGSIDHYSVEYPSEYEVSFNLLDKLTALTKIETIPARTEKTSLYNRMKVPGGLPFIIFNKENKRATLSIVRDDGLVEPQIPLYGQILYPGEVFELPVESGTKPLAFVKEVLFDPHYNFAQQIILEIESEAEFETTIYLKPEDDLKTFSKEIYGTDIIVYKNGKPDKYDLLQLFKNFIRSVYPETLIVNNSGLSEYLESISIFSLLMDSRPLGEKIQDYILQMAEYFKSYIFFNRLSHLVIQNKNVGIARKSISNFEEAKKPVKKEFWKVPADAVTIKLKTHLKDEEGKKIEGEAQVRKSENLEPRNNLSITSYSGQVDSKSSADAKAKTLANEKFNFYGLKRNQINFEFHLDDENMLWELTTEFPFNGSDYFTPNMKFDITNGYVNVTGVSRAGKDYDISQVFIPKAPQQTQIINNITNYVAPIAPVQSLTAVEVDDLDIVPLNPSDNLIPTKPLYPRYGDFVEPSIRNYSGTGNLKLTWKHTIGSEGDSQGQFRFAISTKTEYWQDKECLVCRAVQLTKKELESGKEYVIFVRIKNTEEVYYSNNCYPSNIDFTEWAVIDRIPVSNLKLGDTVSYSFPAMGLLDKYVEFWVGLVIPKTSFTNTYYKFSSFTENEFIEKVSDQAPTLPQAYLSDPENLFKNQQWKYIIEERVGSGFLSMLYVEQIGTGNFVSGIENGQGYAVSSMTNPDFSSENKKLIVAEYDYGRFRKGITNMDDLHPTATGRQWDIWSPQSGPGSIKKIERL